MSMSISDEALLMQAAKDHGSLEDVERYLSSRRVSVNCQDRYGCTPLYWASYDGCIEVVKILLKYKADPNIGHNTWGYTPLNMASRNGHSEVVKLLLKYNADPNISSKDLNTALHRACEFGYKNVVQCLVENGASIEARNKNNETPIDILKRPQDAFGTSEGRRDCLDWLKKMGYLEDASAVPIADLSTEVSSSSPSIDKMDSYGLSMDADPSSLSSQGSPILADIKVFTVDDDEVSTPSFKFPEKTKPVSAVYTISLSDNIPVRTLRIRHCADPNNPEELEQLMFVKSSDDSSSKFEAVPGGTFKPGEQYGEITPPHMCSWTIVGTIKKLFKKAQYVGTILYQTVKQHPDVWIVQLLVAKHDSTSILALNEYINNNCGHNAVKEPEFLFTFEDSDKPKLGLTTEKDERVLKCSNGWEISLDMYEISQDTVDSFKRPTDVPGRCSLMIHTHMNPCHELALLPTVTLNGIISDKKDVKINPPIPDSAAEFERDNTNIRPQSMKNKGEVPTLEAVFDLLKRYSARWNEFGRALRISHNDRQILYDERISADARLEKVIYQWIESQCSPVTWDNLIDVLRRMGLKDVIEDCDIETPTAESGSIIPEPMAEATSTPKAKLKTTRQMPVQDSICICL